MSNEFIIMAKFGLGVDLWWIWDFENIWDVGGKRGGGIVIANSSSDSEGVIANSSSGIWRVSDNQTIANSHSQFDALNHWQ